MKRRNFLKNIAKAAAFTPFYLNGLPVQAINKQGIFKQLEGVYDDRIIVLIQMHGGNDGLNMVIPVEQYADYQGMRANIAIPDSGTRSYIELDNTLPLNAQVGLHPDMGPLKTLYDEGKMTIVQGVGYSNHNKSHFRSRDIWWMGGDYDEYYGSGWMGRYLDHEYPNYPAAFPSTEMPDPLALEIGSSVSLGFHRANGIPVAMANTDPDSFANLISGLGGPQPNTVPANNYGGQINHILGLFDNANDYATQLQGRYNAGTNHVVYPQGNIDPYPYTAPSNRLENPLGWQLQTVARLINGGCKTRMYLVKIPSFDMHNGQVDTNDTTMGWHAARLYQLSTAVKAFMDDMVLAGNDEKVLACTFSEFGRRPASNGSFGTDHGTAAPMMLFGTALEGGVVGTHPDLTNLDGSNNLMIQHDYRQVFTTLLSDFFGADSAAITAAQFEDYLPQTIPLIADPYNANAVLPIDLTSFRGWYDNRFNQLEWKTATEQNNSHFNVMHSTNGHEFTKIGELDGHGDSQESHTYTFTHKNFSLGDNYYRLQQVDYDDKTTLSQIVHLHSGGEMSINIYPNPVRVNLKCNIFSPKRMDNIKIMVSSVMGAKVRYMDVALMQGANSFSIPMGNLANGIYVLQITDGNRLLKTERFVKS